MKSKKSNTSPPNLALLVIKFSKKISRFSIFLIGESIAVIEHTGKWYLCQLNIVHLFVLITITTSAAKIAKKNLIEKLLPF